MSARAVTLAAGFALAAGLLPTTAHAYVAPFSFGHPGANAAVHGAARAATAPLRTAARGAAVGAVARHAASPAGAGKGAGGTSSYATTFTPGYDPSSPPAYTPPPCDPADPRCPVSGSTCYADQGGEARLQQVPCDAPKPAAARSVTTHGAGGLVPLLALLGLPLLALAAVRSRARARRRREVLARRDAASDAWLARMRALRAGHDRHLASQRIAWCWHCARPAPLDADGRCSVCRRRHAG